MNPLYVCPLIQNNRITPRIRPSRRVSFTAPGYFPVQNRRVPLRCFLFPYVDLLQLESPKTQSILGIFCNFPPPPVPPSYSSVLEPPSGLNLMHGFAGTMESR